MQEEDLCKVLELAHEAIRVQVKAQEELRDMVGVKGKREYTKPVQNEELREKVNAFAKQKVYEVAKGKFSKADRSEKFEAIKEELMEYLKKDLNVAEGEELPDDIKKLAKQLLWRSAILCGTGYDI